jgi:hypothetical protein
VKIILGALVVTLSAVASVRANDHPFEASGGRAETRNRRNRVIGLYLEMVGRAVAISARTTQSLGDAIVVPWRAARL